MQTPSLKRMSKRRRVFKFMKKISREADVVESVLLETKVPLDECNWINSSFNVDFKLKIMSLDASNRRNSIIQDGIHVLAALERLKTSTSTEGAISSNTVTPLSSQCNENEKILSIFDVCYWLYKFGHADNSIIDAIEKQACKLPLLDETSSRTTQTLYSLQDIANLISFEPVSTNKDDTASLVKEVYCVI